MNAAELFAGLVWFVWLTFIGAASWSVGCRLRRTWQRRRQSAREPSSGQACWSFAYVRRSGVGVLLFHRDGEPRFVWEVEQNIRGGRGLPVDVSQCPEALRFCEWLNSCERYR